MLVLDAVRSGDSQRCLAASASRRHSIRDPRMALAACLGVEIPRARPAETGQEQLLEVLKLKLQSSHSWPAVGYGVR